MNTFLQFLHHVDESPQTFQGSAEDKLIFSGFLYFQAVPPSGSLEEILNHCLTGTKKVNLLNVCKLLFYTKKHNHLINSASC